VSSGIVATTCGTPGGGGVVRLELAEVDTVESDALLDADDVRLLDAELDTVEREAEVLAEVLAVENEADVDAVVVRLVEADVVAPPSPLTITPLILTCAWIVVLWMRNSSPPPKSSPNQFASSIHVYAGAVSPGSIGKRTLTR
jgi:hypothetical protein